MQEIQRQYKQRNVSGLTLSEIAAIIKSDDIEYSGDYGLKVQDEVKLVFSTN